MSKKKRVDREGGELKQLYAEQMQMLADRCDAFYAGKVHEAKNAAGIISTLVSEQGQTSLLKQLELKDAHQFLDSRHRNRLCMNTARGSWPTTIMPFKLYREKDLYNLDEWWEKQEFQLWYSDVIVTRTELVGLIRNHEGQHVDAKTPKKIAAVRRARSGWHRQITENEDGTTQMYVGVTLSKQPLPEDSGMEEISDYELASVIAIAEELLFSLTPEPANRLRMHIEAARQPYYMTQEESDAAKEVLKEDVAELEKIVSETDDAANKAIVGGILGSLKKTLEIECLTSEDYAVRKSVAHQLKLLKIVDWPDPE